MGQCEGGSCETKSGECGESSCESSCESKCPCGTDCGGDPVSCAMGMWGKSFFCAMKELQVEIMKEKIKKAWGAKMDKAADIILEAMGAKWKAKLAEVSVRADVREKLARLYEEGKR